MRIAKEQEDERGFFFLLGIHWGGLPESWILGGKTVESKGMSGMTVVTPAWEILRVLERPRFREQRAEVEKTLKPSYIQEE